ncbi:MAG: 5'-methylthioadenosine/S-adenosylhomocysteine nucleosidase [Candidatus Coproplasma sp.]
MTVFVIAMESEAQCAIDNMDGAELSVVFDKKVAQGKIGGTDTAVVICGVGKVNAAIGAQYAIDKLGADRIINLGVAGGLNGTMSVGGVYSISHAVQYDFDLVQLNGTAIGTLNEFEDNFLPLNTVDLYPFKKLGTGDRFNDSVQDFKLLTEVLGADIRDMECGAIAQVCAHAGVKLYSFKAISDLAGSGSTTEQFKNNLQLCNRNLTGEVRRIFEAVNNG